MVTLELILKTCQSIKTLGKSRVKRSTVYRMTLKCIFFVKSIYGKKVHWRYCFKAELLEISQKNNCVGVSVK